MDNTGKTSADPDQSDRRTFVGGLAATVASTLLVSRQARAATNHSIKAVAFDAFAIFDPRPVFALAEHLFPGRGAELSNQWRTRQFEYTWLRNSMGLYADFQNVTEDALKYAAAQMKMEVTSEQSGQLLSAYLWLTAWPDVLPTLQALRERKIKLALLSNFTPLMLSSSLKASSLESLFDFQLSTDRAQAFKPDPRAYAMGPEALGLPKEQIAFVAFAGWDAAGAKHFGFPTYWANRLALPAEKLGVQADATSADLRHLLEFVQE